MPFVVDASMALAWHIESERGDYTASLCLAMREGLPIATLDADLVAAAKRVGLPDLE